MGNFWIKHGLPTRPLRMEENWYSTWVLFPTRIGAVAPRRLRHLYLAKDRIDVGAVDGPCPGGEMHLPRLSGRSIGVPACGSMGFWNVLLTCCLPLLLSNHALAQSLRSGNPILPGWYADPEAHIFHNEYWIYPTYSAPYGEQVFMDAFSSKDLGTWKKHRRVLDEREVRWASRPLGAPPLLKKAARNSRSFG